MTVATADFLTRKEVPAGSRVEVRWELRKLPCVSLRADVEEWRCGTVERSPSTYFRVFFLDFPPGTPRADIKAAELFDKQAADLVVIGKNGWSNYTDFPEISGVIYYLNPYKQLEVRSAKIGRGVPDLN